MWQVPKSVRLIPALSIAEKHVEIEGRLNTFRCQWKTGIVRHCWLARHSIRGLERSKTCVDFLSFRTAGETEGRTKTSRSQMKT